MKHLIDDCRFTDDGSWVRCRCDVRVEGATPEVVAELWQRHRLDSGEKRGGMYERTSGLNASPWRKDNSIVKEPKSTADYQREWRERNPGLHAERMRRYRARQRGEAAA